MYGWVCWACISQTEFYTNIDFLKLESIAGYHKKNKDVTSNKNSFCFSSSLEHHYTSSVCTPHYLFYAAGCSSLLLTPPPHKKTTITNATVGAVSPFVDLSFKGNANS